jgi:hypothetical protein
MLGRYKNNMFQQDVHQSHKVRDYTCVFEENEIQPSLSAEESQDESSVPG